MYDVITMGSCTIDLFVDTGKDLFRLTKDGQLSVPYGSKILVKSMNFEIGGGGTNTAGAFSTFGLKVALLGKIGDDHNADKIFKYLNSIQCDTSLLIQEEGPSDYSVILDAKGRDRTILTLKDKNDKLRFNEINLSKLNSKWFYLCTMLGDSLETQIKISKYAKENNIGIMYNPSSYLIRKGIEKFEEILNNSNIICVNFEEAKLITGHTDPRLMADSLLTYGPSMAVITDGSHGAYAFTKKEGYMIVPNEVNVKETTGAGDSFGAGFLTGFMKTMNIKIALEYGATEAESVIQYLGAKNKFLNLEEINSKINEYPHKIIKIK
ncbi:MAG: carbohydrate kinase family protein [Candidatus Methanofastidiosum sp.]|nr:carbohydrate kinase family protein [Methanofastidiosum sp.]